MSQFKYVLIGLRGGEGKLNWDNVLKYASFFFDLIPKHGYAGAKTLKELANLDKLEKLVLRIPQYHIQDGLTHSPSI